MVNPIGDTTTRAAEFALDALAQRRRITADNVANAMTPGYRAQELDFEASLAAAIAGGDVSAARMTTTQTADAPRADGNNVQLDKELAGTSGLHFEALVQVMNFKHQIFSAAVRP